MLIKKFEEPALFGEFQKAGIAGRGSHVGPLSPAGFLPEI